MINKDRLVEEFINAVRISSLGKQEGLYAAHIRKRLEALGMEVAIDEEAGKKAGSNTGNIVGRLKGNIATAPTLLFCAHMDTVAATEGLEPVVREETIYSRGDTILGADDKSGIEAVLEAIRHLKEENLPHGDLEVLFTVGEEIGLLGSRYQDMKMLRASMGFVLDSGGRPGTVINQGPTQDKIKATIKGKAAHAGICPEEGISAIQVAARAIDSMKLLRIDDETTANVGVIAGGNATNVVCDRVTLEGEARSQKGEKLDAQTAHMVKCLEEACRAFGAEVEVQTERMYPPFSVKEQEPVIRLAREAAEAAGLPFNLKFTGGGSDTNFLNVRGIPSINLATGMDKVHSTEERISIRDLVDTARYVAAIIERAGKIK